MGKKIVENEISESEDISLLDRTRLELSRKQVNALSSGSTGWGMLERTRALDYVTLQGLSTLTGCEATNLDALIMKELVDNGLDAARGVKPRIGVTLETGGDFLMLTVRDNGEGMLTSDIERIVDYSRLYSTKFHDRTPSRGALGNAYNILLGAPYALAAEVGRARRDPGDGQRERQYGL